MLSTPSISHVVRRDRVALDTHNPYVPPPTPSSMNVPQWFLQRTFLMIYLTKECGTGPFRFSREGSSAATHLRARSHWRIKHFSRPTSKDRVQSEAMVRPGSKEMESFAGQK